MKISKGKCGVKTERLGTVRFGVVIQLLEKPKHWATYHKWSEDKLYLLTKEYDRGRRCTPSSADDKLLCIELETGSGVGVVPDTQVIERHDVVVCIEPS